MNTVSELLHTLLPGAVVVAIAAPVVVATALGLFILASGRTPSERRVSSIIGVGLTLSLVGSLLAVLGSTGLRELDLGPWILLGKGGGGGGYEVPIVFLVDSPALAFSLLAAGMTALVARFSRTYLHKDPGFTRFYVLLGLFSSGTQLISFAGALDLMFLGWELIGLSSMLFIGFFHERSEPVRSSMRAFVTYRVCDAGFLFAIVGTHELLNSTRLSALSSSSMATLSAGSVTALALLFLLAAIGKSAQLPFSGWLPRAMEGPTPSSALFYGGVSIHAGLFLLLRIWPVLEAAPIARAVGVVVGIATAVYATLVARTCNDAKGALAHATLAQVGLILAEIALGWTTLAQVHLTGHVLLRVWQYLRAPNMIHDAHRTHVAGHASSSSSSSPFFAHALFRLRLDERLDRVVDVVLAAARLIDRFVFLGKSTTSAWRAQTPALSVVVVVAAAGAFATTAASAPIFGSASSIVFAAGAVLALIAGLASVVQRRLQGLLRTKVAVHVSFMLCAVASGHDGAIAFAALTALVPVAGFGYLVAVVERRCGPVTLDAAGGRVAAFPHLAAAFALIGAAGVGLPGSVGFVADDLLLHAAWEQGVAVTGALIAAAVLLAVGTLRAWQRVFLGPARRSVAPDLQPAERAVVVAVVCVVLVLGIAPGLLLGFFAH
ncbi:MAG: proton-conducting transporter membrane subunit [Deltaproteobacteria bacterium]|nr:proton-conducting transporter membrane subunit [Deltaproteobacteria bacterium]